MQGAVDKTPLWKELEGHQSTTCRWDMRKKENIRLTRKVLNELGKLPRQDNVNALSPECCCIKHSHENDIRISFMFIKIR